jgi:BON domain
MANREEGRWRGSEPSRWDRDRDWYGSGREGRSDWEGSWTGGRPSREPEYERYSTREGYGLGEPLYGRGYERPYGYREDYPRSYRGAGMESGYGAGIYGFTGYGAVRERGAFAGRGPKGYRRSDERIREDVNDRLTWNSELDATDIDVRVSDGEVTLTGVVEDRRAKRLAEDLVEDVFGVQDVQNQLKIRHGFLAGLTGEKADEREVAVTAGRERSETTRRETRTGTSTGRAGRT